MGMNGTLKYGLSPVVILADNIRNFAGCYPLKKDDPDGHEQAISELMGTEELAEAVDEMGLIHLFSLSRAGDSMFFQTNFDGDVVAYFEAFESLGGTLRELMSHLEGCPSADAPFTELLEFLAAGQVNVFTYYCSYPELTVAQIRRDADWRGKAMEFQKSLARPADKPVVCGQALGHPV